MTVAASAELGDLGGRDSGSAHCFPLRFEAPGTTLDTAWKFFFIYSSFPLHGFTFRR